MLIEIEYKTKEELQKILDEQKAAGVPIKEFATRLDGRQLVIVEVPDIPVKSPLELQLEALTTEVNNLKADMTTTKTDVSSLKTAVNIEPVTEPILK